MQRQTSISAAVLMMTGVVLGIGSLSSAAPKFQALKCPEPALGRTWAVIDHDGANRKVTPYLSSLGSGEGGTGRISSPPFIVDSDQITFTVCGHDGEKGGRNENYVALVDARKGEVLLKTPAPQNDAMQERSWKVKDLRGTQVRFELRDGNSGGGFAWMGCGRIDAGPAMQIDFSKGMPKDWAEPQTQSEVKYETLTGGVPFKRAEAIYTVIPRQGSVEIPCGFAADRLYFLGGVAPNAKPLETYGGIEVHYRGASPEVFPLMCGFTLDDSNKLPSPSASHLHPSSDPYQSYLVIQPGKEVIEKIRLVASPEGIIPRITAVTCETGASADTLMPLPESAVERKEQKWIERHAIAHWTLDLNRVMHEIRKAYRMPAPQSSIGFRKRPLDAAFRGEGVAIADLNGDGRADIATGNVYYAAPDWKMVSMVGEAKAFNRYGYSDAFLCFADDVNRDGAIDLIEVGFPGQTTHWLENPGKAGGEWKKHLAIEKTGDENPAYLDVDGDGRAELVFMSEGKCAFAQPGTDPAQPWTIRVIAGPGDPSAGHGMGVGDVNRDGKLDVLIPDGWWEQPASASSEPWKFHAVKFYGAAQLCVADIDGDGDSDVLSSSPHGYGIGWCEQTPEGWKTHEIDTSYSQTHAIAIADMNGDGLPDFVTGKRFWAHNGHDPGSFQPSVLCWYEQVRRDGKVEWTRHLIDAQSGVGLQFQIVDLNGDKRPDIVTSNKNGVYYFQQLSGAPQARN